MALTVAGLEHNQLCRLSLAEDGSLRYAQQALLQPQKRPASTGIVMALPAADVVRRQLPKPFQKRRHLLRIAPAMTEDTLLDGMHTQVFDVVENGLSPSLFTTFGVDTAILHTRAEGLGRYLSRVRLAVPTCHGLTWFAPKGQACVIVCARNHDVLTILVDSTGRLLDFRQIGHDRWQREAALCLRPWLSLCLPETPLLTIGEVTLPSTLDKPTRAITLPPSVTPDLAPLYGIALHLHHGTAHLPRLRVADGTLQTERTLVADRLVRVAGVLLVASALIAGMQMYRHHAVAAQAAAYQTAVSEVITSILPGVPEVDPMLQVSRRLSQLRLFTGAGDNVSDGTPLLDTLNILHTEAEAAGMTLRLERVELTAGKLLLHGQVDSFADVDDLQTRLSARLGRTLELKNAQTREGKVHFQLEGGA
jgi:hypothetical protein